MVLLLAITGIGVWVIVSRRSAEVFSSNFYQLFFRSMAIKLPLVFKERYVTCCF